MNLNRKTTVVLNHKTYGTIVSAMEDGICWQEDLAEAHAHMPVEYGEIKKRIARSKRALASLTQGVMAQNAVMKGKRKA